MSYFIRIICERNVESACVDLARYVVDGSFYDDGPVFVPDIDTIVKEGDACRAFSIVRQLGARPIIAFAISSQDESYSAEMDELLVRPELLSLKEETITMITDFLRNSAGAIIIDVDVERIDDEEWNMLDNIEMYFARELNGLIFAEGEGFYDSHLSKLV